MGAFKKIGELALREQVFKYSGHVFAGKGSGISVHKIYVGNIVIAVRVVGGVFRAVGTVVFRPVGSAVGVGVIIAFRQKGVP